MNSRIEIVSDTEVRIAPLENDEKQYIALTARNPRKVQMEWINCTGGWRWFDAEGRAALRDCINCLDATGSFAALADTSAVPFCGKKMRLASGESVIVLETGLNFANACHCMRGDGTIVSKAASDLRPLVSNCPTCGRVLADCT